MGALALALPRLRAEEALDHAARVALGSGSLRPDDARELHRVWESRAQMATPRRSTLAEWRVFAHAAGMAVEGPES